MTTGEEHTVGTELQSGVISLFRDETGRAGRTIALTLSWFTEPSV